MGLSITTTVKARYANGVFEPLDEVDLMDGCEVTLTVVRSRASRAGTEFEERELEAIFAAAEPPPGEHRTFADFLAWLKDVQSKLPPDTWDGYPTDGARNYKHYLYGHPKEEEE